MRFLFIQLEIYNYEHINNHFQSLEFLHHSA